MILPGDHFIANKNPDRFNRAVEAFLREGFTPPGFRLAPFKISRLTRSGQRMAKVSAIFPPSENPRISAQKMDIKLHYTEQGEGDPLILLHGNGEDGTHPGIWLEGG